MFGHCWQCICVFAVSLQRPRAPKWCECVRCQKLNTRREGDRGVINRISLPFPCNYRGDLGVFYYYCFVPLVDVSCVLVGVYQRWFIYDGHKKERQTNRLAFSEGREFDVVCSYRFYAWRWRTFEVEGEATLYSKPFAIALRQPG